MIHPCQLRVYFFKTTLVGKDKAALPSTGLLCCTILSGGWGVGVHELRERLATTSYNTLAFRYCLSKSPLLNCVDCFWLLLSESMVLQILDIFQTGLAGVPNSQNAKGYLGVV